MSNYLRERRPILPALAAYLLVVVADEVFQTVLEQRLVDEGYTTLVSLFNIVELSIGIGMTFMVIRFERFFQSLGILLALEALAITIVALYPLTGYVHFIAVGNFLFSLSALGRINALSPMIRERIRRFGHDDGEVFADTLLFKHLIGFVLSFVLPFTPLIVATIVAALLKCASIGIIRKQDLKIQQQTEEEKGDADKSDRRIFLVIIFSAGLFVVQQGMLGVRPMLSDDKLITGSFYAIFALNWLVAPFVARLVKHDPTGQRQKRLFLLSRISGALLTATLATILVTGVTGIGWWGVPIALYLLTLLSHGTFNRNTHRLANNKIKTSARFSRLWYIAGIIANLIVYVVNKWLSGQLYVAILSFNLFAILSLVFFILKSEWHILLPKKDKEKNKEKKKKPKGNKHRPKRRIPPQRHQQAIRRRNRRKRQNRRKQPKQRKRHNRR